MTIKLSTCHFSNNGYSQFRILCQYAVRRKGYFKQISIISSWSATLLLISGTDPYPIGTALWFALGFYCLASATQDVAIDAYSIAITRRGDEGPVTSVKAVAARLSVGQAAAKRGDRLRSSQSALRRPCPGIAGHRTDSVRRVVSRPHVPDHF